MFQRLILSASLLVVALSAERCLAWNAKGHKVVALIAWEQLSPAERTAMSSLLRKHPRFSQDFAGPLAQQLGNNASQNEQDRWILCQAAIWPDIARGFSQPALGQYHRPRWHYINLPVFLDPTQADQFAGSITANLSFDYPSSLDPEDFNVVQAVKHNFATAQSVAANDAEKAVSLCWLLHDIADLHQPAHAAALFTVELFPTGDRGANSIDVRMHTGGRTNLHSVWDGLLGTGRSFNGALNKAANLIAAHPTEFAAPVAPMPHDAWTTENQQLALLKLYGPILDELRDAESAGDLDDIDLTSSYLSDSGAVAGRQAVIAGVRLASVLRTVVQPGPTPLAVASRELGFPAAIADASSASRGVARRGARASDGDLERRVERLEAALAELQGLRQSGGPNDSSTAAAAAARALRATGPDDGEQCTCGAEEVDEE